MKALKVTKLTKDYVVIAGEKIWFDEPFKKAPSKNEFEQWLKKIKDILEKLLVTENK